LNLSFLFFRKKTEINQKKKFPLKPNRKGPLFRIKVEASKRFPQPNENVLKFALHFKRYGTTVGRHGSLLRL
jgi:hypothetical protein